MTESEKAKESKIVFIVNFCLIFAVVLLNGSVAIYSANYIIGLEALKEYKILRMIIVVPAIIISTQITTKIFFVTIRQFPSIAKGIYTDDDVSK